METRIQHIFLVLSLSVLTLLWPITAYANDLQPVEWDESSKITEPEIKRKSVDIANIDALDFEAGIFFGQMNIEDFGSNSVAGISLTYHVTEDIIASASVGQSEAELTSFEVISGIRLLTEDQRKYQYYDLSVGLNLLPGEGFIGDAFAFNSYFYGLVGVGSTKFAGDQRFTTSVALGYKIVMNDWLAVHAEVKDHIFDIDILGSDKTTHNMNYTIGFSVFF